MCIVAPTRGLPVMASVTLPLRTLSGWELAVPIEESRSAVRRSIKAGNNLCTVQPLMPLEGRWRSFVLDLMRAADRQI